MRNAMTWAGGTDTTLQPHFAPWDWRALSDQSGQRAFANNLAANAQATKDQKAALASAGSTDAWQQQQRDAITKLTEGRAQDILNDPTMRQSTDFFGRVLSGQAVPFSQEVQRAQLNQQANATAQANAAQLRALEDAIVAQGGSLNDPSFLAKKQELMSQRQGANLDALGRMLSQAGVANYQAQAQGASALAGIRGAQNAQANAMGLAGAGYRAQDFRDTPTGGFGDNGRSFTTTSWSFPPVQPVQPTGFQGSGWAPNLGGNGLAGGPGSTWRPQPPAPTQAGQTVGINNQMGSMLHTSGTGTASPGPSQPYRPDFVPAGWVPPATQPRPGGGPIQGPQMLYNQTAQRPLADTLNAGLTTFNRRVY